MAISLGRYLNVRRSERPRLAWLYAMLFTSILGCVWGEAVIEAGFLRSVGVQYLPLAIICSALVSMGSISVYNLFADRIANHRLLIWILALSLLGIGAGALMLARGAALAAFALLYVLDSVLVRDLLNVHWPIYVNGFFDTQSAKRIFPVLSSASRLAAIIGGLTMPLMNRGLSPTGIITLMLLAQFAMMALALLMRRALRDSGGQGLGKRPALDRSSQSRSAHSKSAGASARANIEEGYRYVTGSRYLRWITAATFLTMVLLAFLNYETGRILLADLKTVQNISNFTALLRGLGNLIALPFQLFLLSRLIGRIGVGNANLIYPSTSLVAVSSLALAPGLVAAGFGYLTRVVLRNTFYIPVDSLLYNAVPLRMKARARGFISGYVMTAGSLAGGLVLMFNAQLAGPGLGFPGLGFPSLGFPLLRVLFVGLALAYLGSAFQVRRYYGKAVVAMLEQNDYLSLQTPSDAELSVVDDATLSNFAAKLAQSDVGPETKAFTAQVICQIGDTRAVPIISSAIREADDAHLRARLLEVLATSGSNAAAAGSIYESCLADPDKEVRQAALAGLEEIVGDNGVLARDRARDHARFQALVAPLLADREPEVRAAALSALVRTGSFHDQPAAGRLLETLLSSDVPETRALAVRLLGRLAAVPEEPAQEFPANQGFAARLLASLSDPTDSVRLAAALALEEAAGPPDSQLPGWLPARPLGQLLPDRVERVRQAAAGLLARSPQPEARALLIGALADPSPLVRSAAVDSLVQAGPPVIGLVRPLLDSKKPEVRTMAAAVLGRIDAAQFGPVILSGCVTDFLEEAYLRWGYIVALGGGALEGAGAAPARSPALEVLRCAFSELNAQRVEDIFYLLRAIRPPQTVDKTAASLRSQDPLARANAVEALEVLTTPQIARLLGPLCEEPPVTRHILAIGGATWGQRAPNIDETIGALIARTEDAWLSELAAIVRAPGASSPCAHGQEEHMLSAIEKVIFLKEVPFFQGMTVDQLRVLANVCEEEFFPAESRLFNEGDPGGTLYVVVSGRVAIEQEKRRGPSAQRSVARLATIEAHSYLGETDFFDTNCRTNSASAIQDTLVLKLRREPLIALARQHPDLSLELINVLSARLREANERIAELTRAHPQKLHRLYDQLG